MTSKTKMYLKMGLLVLACGVLMVMFGLSGTTGVYTGLNLN